MRTQALAVVALIALTAEAFQPAPACSTQHTRSRRSSRAAAPLHVHKQRNTELHNSEPGTSEQSALLRQMAASIAALSLMVAPAVAADATTLIAVSKWQPPAKQTALVQSSEPAVAPALTEPVTVATPAAAKWQAPTPESAIIQKIAPVQIEPVQDEAGGAPTWRRVPEVDPPGGPFEVTDHSTISLQAHIASAALRSLLTMSCMHSNV
jgi:hypothetical protein